MERLEEKVDSGVVIEGLDGKIGGRSKERSCDVGFSLKDWSMKQSVESLISLSLEEWPTNREWNYKVFRAE